MKAIRSDCFKYIYSIEFDTLRHITNKEKFSMYDNVTIIKGDSGKLLKHIIKHIDVPCTFWLDAHFSNDDAEYSDKWTPIVEELEAIKNHPIKDHTIIVDDFRCMDNMHFDEERNIPIGFPGKEKLLETLRSINPDYNITFVDGVEPNDVVIADVEYKKKIQITLDEIIDKIEYEETLINVAEDFVEQLLYNIVNESKIVSTNILDGIIDTAFAICNETLEEKLARKERELWEWEEELNNREVLNIDMDDVCIEMDDLKLIEHKINKMDEELLEKEIIISNKEKELLIKEEKLIDKEDDLNIKELVFQEMIIDLHLQDQIKIFKSLETKSNSRDARKQKRKRHTKN